MADNAFGFGPPRQQRRKTSLVRSPPVLGHRTAWFPPHLIDSNRPGPEYPLPLPADRELTLPEKYAALVAIHALHWKGEEIAPWQPPPWDENKHRVSRMLSANQPGSGVGWLLHKNLLSGAATTPESDTPALRYILKDVAADLKAQLPADGGHANRVEAVKVTLSAPPDAAAAVERVYPSAAPNLPGRTSDDGGAVHPQADQDGTAHVQSVSPVEPSNEAKRRGRLPKAHSDAKRAQMLAILRQHSSLKEDVSKLAAMVGVAESTARRWIHEEQQKYLESKAARPEPADE